MCDTDFVNQLGIDTTKVKATFNQQRVMANLDLNSRPTPTNQNNTFLSTTNNTFVNNSNNSYSTASNNVDENNEGSNTMMCTCGISASLHTVRKEGPNTGREFFSCGNNKACTFFLWKDNNTNSTVNTVPSTRIVPNMVDMSTSDNIMCNCNEQAKQLVNKKMLDKSSHFCLFHET